MGRFPATSNNQGEDEVFRANIIKRHRVLVVRTYEGSIHASTLCVWSLYILPIVQRFPQSLTISLKRCERVCKCVYAPRTSSRFPVTRCRMSATENDRTDYLFGVIITKYHLVNNTNSVIWFIAA